jgi:hypothetical protein
MKMKLSGNKKKRSGASTDFGTTGPGIESISSILRINGAPGTGT